MFCNFQVGRSRGTWFLLGSTSPARLPEGRRGVDGSMEESEKKEVRARPGANVAWASFPNK